ncbi:MAG: sigma 54-interacting transcriptional regulator [Polyangiaceae bacterium]|nr:sigma 54-interacting transcriptional regulator [Polyangiaceae bacterium]
MRRVPLPHPGEVTIGRDEGCEVFVPDGAISKRHARLSVTADGGVLTDLGSKNGTRFGGSRISEPTSLTSGDVFELGPLTFVFRREIESGGTVEADSAPIVADPAMRAVVALAEQVAPSDLPVLILGETGSGKEVLATLIHGASLRAKKPLVRLNCAALPVNLLEAELFGNEPGAFTGAVGAKPGLVEEANGGTLFLDEVGELPLEAQTKVLRAIEDGTFYRVGGRRAVQVDVRFIAATNRDLDAGVATGAFRSDLFYRLAGITLRIPPLRERPAEILVLAERFVSEAARALSLGASPEIADDARDVLKSHAFPGNVRELKNTMLRAVLLSRGGPLSANHLMLESQPRPAVPSGSIAPTIVPPPMPPPPIGGAAAGDLRTEMQALERDRIQAALDACAGNQTRAAAKLGISRRTLISRIESLGIARPTKG